MNRAPPPRLPAILFWIAFLLVMLLLGPVGYALVSLDSRPGGSGADWPAKLLVALLVLGAALLAGFAVHTIARLLLGVARRPPT